MSYHARVLLEHQAERLGLPLVNFIHELVMSSELVRNDPSRMGWYVRLINHRTDQAYGPATYIGKTLDEAQARGLPQYAKEITDELAKQWKREERALTSAAKGLDLPAHKKFERLWRPKDDRPVGMFLVLVDDQGHALQRYHLGDDVGAATDKLAKLAESEAWQK